MYTNKVQIVGTIDGQPVDCTMEFASLDKAGVINLIKTYSSSQKGALTFTDIHGNILNFNFPRSRVVQLKVIDVIDAR